MKKVRRFVARSALTIGVVLIFFLILLTQTPIGRERVLREVLAQVGERIQGQIEVTEISSPGLLGGFTFRDVLIRGEDGGTFLQADSVRAGVSGPALLRGDLILTGIHLWRPRVTLERLPDWDRMNVVSIFVGQPNSDSSLVVPDTVTEGSGEEDAGPRRTIILRGAEIHQGSLDILLPISPERRNVDNILVEPGSDGRPPLRRMSFRDIDLDLIQAVLRSPGQNGERFEVNHLSFDGEVWPDPFRITGAEGEIRREGPRLVARLRALDLTNSRTQGNVDVRWGGGQGVRVDVQGDADPLTLDDIFFIEDRLPSGTARGPFGLQLSDEGVLLDFQETELVSDQGRIQARGGLFLGREIGFRDLAMEMSDLDLAVTDPWVMDTLPLRGWVDGNLFMAGDLGELEVESLLDFTDEDSLGVMTADISGRMGFREGFSASSLHLTLAPLEWRALASVSPLMTLRGPGAVRLVLTGSLAGDGLGIDADLTHLPRGGRAPSSVGLATGDRVALAAASGASRVTVRGRMQRADSDLSLNLTGELGPLSLTSIRRSFPALPLEGEYAGTVDLNGSLSDLEVKASLNTSGGPLTATARFDARRVADSYVVEAVAEEEFVLSALLPSFPDPTLLSGRVSATGRGLTLNSLQGEATVEVSGGEVGALEVDTAVLEARVQDGVLFVQELKAETGLGHIGGSGSFGVASTAPPGELTIEIQSKSLEALRPFLLEEPDPLSQAPEVPVGGSLEGNVVLRGGFGGFTGEGALDFQGLRLRADYVESGAVTFTSEGLPGGEGRIHAQIRTDSLNIRSLGFHAGNAEVDIGKREGRLRATAVRSPNEEYTAQGTYALDSTGGGILNVDEFSLQFDTVRWNLGGPASFAWNSDGYRVRDFQLIRPGTETMRLRADGFLPLGEGGEGDFRVDVERLNLARLARTVQMETPLEGLLDFQGRVTGSHIRPQMVGFVSGRDLRYGDFSLSGLESDLSYQDERINLDLTAHDGEDGILSAEGFFPADLRIVPDTARIPEGPVDLRISADSFPAAITLAFLKSLEDVGGTLSGDLHFGGTSTDLEPNGEFILEGGSSVFPALGVRYRGVEAHLLLTPDGVVEVDATLQSGGTASVTGTVTLGAPLSDPWLDLTIDARSFLAMDRRDVQARLSGTVWVERNYKRPYVHSTNLTVEQGVLMVEEVARSVEVVDLSDPAFFDVVDTTAVTLRPIIQDSQNPFLQNLRLDMNLTMAQDGWLRGRELNVEMAGDLRVFWDRATRDLVFFGVLDAVRGVYTVFGRQFQVQEGTVSFPGTPGINPDLNISALNRLRTSDESRLEIIATVEGPLLEPRVALSSNADYAIAESDLVSYLIFGRPSYATSAIQRETSRRAAGVSLAVGLFSSELGSVLARNVGLDYLAISQGQGDELGDVTLFRQSVGTTEVEMGQYLTEDIFAAMHWRPLGGVAGLDPLAAVRIETRLSDHWTLEGYWEERFFGDPLYQSGSLGGSVFDLPPVFGFFLYREWGY